MRPGINMSVALRKGAWTAEEDILLKNYIHKHGEGKWHLVPLKAGLNRCRKSCRLRWVNYLRPNIKRGDFKEDEVDLMLRLHKLLGNRWSLIAGRIPGRTANDVKNYWNTHVRSHPKRQKEELKDGKHSQHDMVSVIKPQPHTFSKTLTIDSHIEPVKMGNLTTSSNDYSMFVSSPATTNGNIKEHFDLRGPLLGVTHVEGEGLDVVEQEDRQMSLFDFPTDDVIWDLLGSYQL